MFSFVLRRDPIANSLDEMPSPRVIRTHLPVQLLPDEIWLKKPKIIYISRDVKDVAVSWYHHVNHTGELEVKPGTIEIELFFENFLNDKVGFAPYRENLLNYLNLPDYDNIHYLTYESMSTDIDATIKNIAKFLGKTILIENEKRLKEHLKFSSMKSKLKLS